jgi:hypothetical protein
MIVLYKPFGNANLGHCSFIAAFEEKAPLIARHARRQDEYARQGSRNLFNSEENLITLCCMRHSSVHGQPG